MSEPAGLPGPSALALHHDSETISFHAVALYPQGLGAPWLLSSGQETQDKGPRKDGGEQISLIPFPPTAHGQSSIAWPH